MMKLGFRKYCKNNCKYIGLDTTKHIYVCRKLNVYLDHKDGQGLIHEECPYRKFYYRVRGLR